MQGNAEDAQLPDLDAHLDACEECRQVVSALVQSAEASSDAFAPTAPSEPNIPTAEGLTPGQVLLGKYEVETLLGAGGMGVVARAHHRVLDRPVVIKLLKTPHASEEAVRRFLREARAAAAIESPHVVRVIDAGQLDAQRPYLVLEHLEGRDLAVDLAERGVVPIAEAVELALQCCEALAMAHARGIVHRDIKPGNLFLTKDSEGHPLLKVLDFGIAKALSDSELATHDASLTESSAVIGSPRYMSPEQLQDSSGVDERTDIWALGAVLYELISGQPAFDAPNLATLATKILTGPCRPLRELAPEVPAKLAEVIERCLRKDRDQRYRTAGELAEALVAAAELRDPGRVARIQSFRGGTTLASRGQPGVPDAPVAHELRTAKWVWLVLAMLTLAVIGLLLSRPPAASPGAVEPKTVAPTQSAVSAGVERGAPSAQPAPSTESALSAAPTAASPPLAHSAATPTAKHLPPARFPSPGAGASAKPVRPTPSGVNVNSDGLLDRK